MYKSEAKHLINRINWIGERLDVNDLETAYGILKRLAVWVNERDGL